MATDTPDASLETSTRELLAVLRDVEAAVEPPGPGRLVKPPTPSGLLEFTSEVGIPAAILILRTNVAALELLQRSLRMMGDHEPRDDRETPVRDRAAGLTAASLSRLDGALTDLQTAIDGSSTDRPPDDLLAEARRRTEELEAQLAASDGPALDEQLDAPETTSVDVEAELDSLRQSIESPDDDDDAPNAEPTDS